MKIFGRGKNDDANTDALELDAEDAGFDDTEGGLSATGRFGGAGGASGGKRVILLVLLVLLLVGGYVSMTMMGDGQPAPVAVVPPPVDAAAVPADPNMAGMPADAMPPLDPATGLPMVPPPAPVVTDAGMPPMPPMPPMPDIPDAAMPAPMMPGEQMAGAPMPGMPVPPMPMPDMPMPAPAGDGTMAGPAIPGQMPPAEATMTLGPDGMPMPPAGPDGAQPMAPDMASPGMPAPVMPAPGVQGPDMNAAASLDPIDAEAETEGMPAMDGLQAPDGAPLMPAPVADAGNAMPPADAAMDGMQPPAPPGAVPSAPPGAIPSAPPGAMPPVPPGAMQADAPNAMPADASALPIDPAAAALPTDPNALPVDPAGVAMTADGLPADAAAGVAGVDPALAAVADPAAPADPNAVAAAPAAPAVAAPPTAEDLAVMLANLPPEPAMVRPMPKEYLIVKKESSADTLDSRLSSARRALNEGRAQAALQFFNELQNDFPNDSRVLMGRAVTLQRLGQNTQALRAYEQVLVNNPQSLDALTNMLGLLKTQNPAMAIEKLQELRDAYPYDADITTQLAISYGQSGNLQEALRYMTLAEALKPDSSYVKYNKAVLYDRLGRRAEAADLYRQLLRLAADGKIDRNIPIESVRNRLGSMR